MRNKVYIHARIDDRSGEWYLQWRKWKLHLAGKTDETAWMDKFIFTAAKNVLWVEQWEVFKKQFNQILNYMAEIDKIGETTKAFCPFLVLYGPDLESEEV